MAYDDICFSKQLDLFIDLVGGGFYIHFFYIIMGNLNPKSQQLQQAATQQPSCSGQDLNYYPIRLLPEQSVCLFGFLEAKTTLTWKDVLTQQSINLKSCVSCGIDTLKLYRMQPDIKEWIRCGKANLSDSKYMNQWKPNPFTDLRCSIGDLVLYKNSLHPKMLVDCGITFTILKERYGLTKEIMIMLRYSVDDWIDLEIDQEFLKELSDDQWARIFGEASRSDIIESSKRKALIKNADDGANT